ncbi:MAG TPA: LapA family protein [Pseudolabrys sp.]|nr:LapA family protein [Pseudolabrys sp.]
MLRRIVALVILVPLGVILIAFAVANRQSVTVSFDPFSAAHPAYAATLPLFGLIFLLLIVGVIVGGVAAWLGQRHYRRAARRLDAEARQLHEEIDAMRRRFAAGDPAPPAQSRPALTIPPPIA